MIISFPVLRPGAQKRQKTLAAHTHGVKCFITYIADEQLFTWTHDPSNRLPLQHDEAVVAEAPTGKHCTCSGHRQRALSYLKREVEQEQSYQATDKRHSQ
jgi:hypothetical protein